MTDRLAAAHRARQPRLARQLDAEWNRLRADRSALAAANRWELAGRPFLDIDDVLAAVGFGRPASAAAESNLRTLACRAGADPLAGRVVVQRLLPGLLAVTRRRGGDPEATFGELLGELWIALATYNSARRPACLAAALLADADYRAFRLGWRRPRFDVQRLDTWHEIAEASPTSARDELDQVLDRAAERGLCDEAFELVGWLASGRTTHEIAAMLDVTDRTIRNRRARVTAELRRLVAA